MLGEVAGHASALYAVLALVLTAGGLATIIRRPSCDHEHPAHPAPRRLSGAFTLGAASALVVSPCCTPVIAAVIGMTAVNPDPLSRATLLGAFALGHSAPLFLAGSLGAFCARPLRRWNASPAPAIVSGSLMLGLGGYYGLLA